MSITRPALHGQVEAALKRAPVTALLGPRQCGKTTLAREIARTRAATFFDLERPADRACLLEGELTLGALTGPVARYLDLLCGALVLRRVPPWHANLGKRLVKSPKVYVRDSGLLHYFLGIRDRHDLLGHPKLGASWEGLVLEELLRVVSERDIHFYSTYSGAECDFVVRSGVDLIGFEAKRSEAPTLTRSMRVVQEDLRLKHLFVVYAGSATFPLHEKVTAIPISALSAGLGRLLRGRSTRL